MTLVLDTSALVAIMEAEPDAEALSAALVAADGSVISALTFYETLIVMFGRRGILGMGRARRFVAETGARIIPFEDAMAEAAAEAMRGSARGCIPRPD